MKKNIKIFNYLFKILRILKPTDQQIVQQQQQLLKILI